MKKILFLLVILFVGLFILAHYSVKRISNLKPTVILVSIDGLQHDALEKLAVPHLSTLAANGVRSGLISTSPHSTVPDHYSMATGLYPQHHGAQNLDPKKWKGEPIWMTAEKQHQSAASAAWPGSEPTHPAYFEVFAEDGNPQARIQQTLQWLDLPASKRPTLIALYFDNVGSAGHRSGLDSRDVRTAAIRVDHAINTLLTGLKTRGVVNDVNIIIVSNPSLPNVQGVFIAEGPAFKTHYTRPPFQSIQIYALVAKVLGLKPARNDASLAKTQDVLV